MKSNSNLRQMLAVAGGLALATAACSPAETTEEAPAEETMTEEAPAECAACTAECAACTAECAAECAACAACTAECAAECAAE